MQLRVITTHILRIKFQSWEDSILNIVSALKAYQKGERKHGTMHANASGLSDQDIIDIANYFESVE